MVEWKCWMLDAVYDKSSWTLYAKLFMTPLYHKPCTPMKPFQAKWSCPFTSVINYFSLQLPGYDVSHKVLKGDVAPTVNLACIGIDNWPTLHAINDHYGWKFLCEILLIATSNKAQRVSDCSHGSKTNKARMPPTDFLLHITKTIISSKTTNKFMCAYCVQKLTLVGKCLSILYSETNINWLVHIQCLETGVSSTQCIDYEHSTCYSRTNRKIRVKNDNDFIYIYWMTKSPS